MTRLTTPLIAVGLLCAGFLAGSFMQTHRLTARMAKRQATIDSLTVVAELRRTELAANLARLDTVVIPKWERIRDTTLVHLTDTIRVREAFQVADTTIRACRRLLQDCSTLVALEKARGDSLAAQVRDARKLGTPRLRLMGYGATDLRGGLYAGVEARVRVFGLEAFGRAEQRVDSTGRALRVGAVIPF